MANALEDMLALQASLQSLAGLLINQKQTNDAMVQNQNINTENNTVQKQLLDSQINSNTALTAEQIASNEKIAQMNIDSNNSIAQMNLQAQRDNLNTQLAKMSELNNQNIAFQQRENDITRQREDTALQRKLADGLAAGLSPLAALGFTGASAGALTAPSNDLGSFGSAYSAYGSSVGSIYDNLLGANSSARNSLLGANNQARSSLMENNNYARNNYSQRKNAIALQRMTDNLNFAKLKADTINSFVKSMNDLGNSLIKNKQIREETRNIKELTRTQKFKNDYYDNYGYSEFDKNRLYQMAFEFLMDKKNMGADAVDRFFAGLDSYNSKKNIEDYKKSNSKKLEKSKKDAEKLNKKYPSYSSYSYSDKTKVQNAYYSMVSDEFPTVQSISVYDKTIDKLLRDSHVVKKSVDWQRYVNSEQYRNFILSSVKRSMSR